MAVETVSRKIKVLVCIGVFVVGVVTGYVIASNNIGLGWSRSLMAKNSLAGEIRKDMPQWGKGEWFIKIAGKPISRGGSGGEYSGFGYWTPAKGEVAQNEPEVWLEKMQTWCAGNGRRIAGVHIFETKYGLGRLFYYIYDDGVGSMFCQAHKTNLGDMECCVKILEVNQ